MHRGCPCCLNPGPGEIRAEDIVVDCKEIYKGGGWGLGLWVGWFAYESCTGRWVFISRNWLTPERSHPSSVSKATEQSIKITENLKNTLNSRGTRVPGGSDGKESDYSAGDPGSLWVGQIPWRRTWQPTPVFLPRESHGQRSLAGCSPWGCRVRHDWMTNTHTIQREREETWFFLS